MKSSRSQSKLLDAFVRGHAREFASAVSNLGVTAAAQLLVEALLCDPAFAGVALDQRQHLFGNKALRGIPSLSTFVGILLKELCRWEASEERKGDFVRMLGPYLRESDLAAVSEPMRLGAYAILEIAHRISALPTTRPWHEAAVWCRLPALLNHFCTPEDRLELWLDLPQQDRLDHVEYLLDENVEPETDAEKLHVLLVLVIHGIEHEKISDLLKAAWPEALKSFQIPHDRCWSRWSGSKLRCLIQIGGSLDREHWIDTFDWARPRAFADQVEGVIDGYRSLINWNQPNADGRKFVEEIFARMDGVTPADRLAVLQKLLEVGTDPTPLTSVEWKSRLLPSENTLIDLAAAKWTKRRDRLRVDAEPCVMTTDLELV